MFEFIVSWYDKTHSKYTIFGNERATSLFKEMITNFDDTKDIANSYRILKNNKLIYRSASI